MDKLGDQSLIVSLYEDEQYGNFLPLTYTRPVYMLRSGMFTTQERTEKMFPKARLLLFTREYLVPALAHKFSFPFNQPQKIDEDSLLINGALVLSHQTLELIERKLRPNVAVTQDGRLAMAYLDEKAAKEIANLMVKPLGSSDVKKILGQCKVLEANTLLFLNYPWDLVDNCSRLISSDYRMLDEKGKAGTIDGRASVYGENSDVYLSEGAFIEPFAMLDVRNGPIYVGRDSVVQSGSRITGPAHIGDDTIIVSALVHEGCSIGNTCRIGGEVENTIVQGYTNKHHLGYFGHAYLGEWVNIGAGTTNSNLKNTYGTVKVDVKGRAVDTGKTKVGCFVGDYAKTSIGTQIYTGRKLGVASHTHGFITEDVASFTVCAKSLGAKPVEVYPESVIETQMRAFARRGVKQTKEDVQLLKKIFALTVQERKKAKVLRKKFRL